MDTMYPGKINSPATTLASGINDIVTTIPLTDASVVPAAPNLAVIGTGEDAETVLYTGISVNDLTGCTRGFQGTAKAWDSGTSVARFFTAYDYDTLRTNLADHDAEETAGVHGSTTANTPLKLVHRDSAGRAMIAAPSVDTHIDNRGARNTAIATHAGLATGVHGAGGNTLWHGGLTNILDKTHLSQDFGASAARLRNVIATPIAGNMLVISNCAGSAFSGLINAGGSGGLTATNVPYDGDTHEDMFNGLGAYDGVNYWGQLILHNITRGNSRKIVSVNRATNVITTTSSTDDWADDDVIDCESQTVDGSPEYVDIDISDFIGTGVDAIFLYVVFQNNTAGDSTGNGCYFHPYTTYDVGKRQWITALTANDQNNVVFLVDVISQKITMAVNTAGSDDFFIILTVKATAEFADT